MAYRYQRDRLQKARPSIRRSESPSDEYIPRRLSYLGIENRINHSSFQSPTRDAPRHRVSSAQRERNRGPCPYQALCNEYLLSLGWPSVYFNTRFNRCYCDQCYPEYKRDSYPVANAPYVIPRGWVRFSLYVDKVKAEVENIWKTWIISYHGTSVDAAKSIVSHRQFLLNGDTCEDGRQLGKRCEDLYTSPTIKYSARDAYAKPHEFCSANGTCYIAKVVFQCRQKPGTYETQGATGGARRERRLCNVIPNDRIELFTQIRSSVVPCGLMVRLTPINS